MATNQEKAEEIVDDVLKELSGRGGVGDSLEAVDPETYDEIENTLVGLVKTRLDNYDKE
jgi:hypothetical protein